MDTRGQGVDLGRRRAHARPGGLGAGVAGRDDARDPRPARALLPAPDHRRRARGRRRARAARASTPRAWPSPGSARAAGSRSPSAGWPTGSSRSCPTCRSCATTRGRSRSPTRSRTARSSQYLAVHRDQEATVLRTHVVPGRRALRPPRDGPGPVLGRAAGPDLPAVDGVRGVQPLRRAVDGGPGDRDRGLRLQPARGRPGVPARRQRAAAVAGLVAPWLAVAHDGLP